ncbi:hypothetical protein BD560DRAFT_200702 [Blakeslea trispora]|nr:hypothetical protein BD560DRAFT_200702 [Blakeslea trispora]
MGLLRIWDSANRTESSLAYSKKSKPRKAYPLRSYLSCLALLLEVTLLLNNSRLAFTDAFTDVLLGPCFCLYFCFQLCLSNCILTVFTASELPYTFPDCLKKSFLSCLTLFLFT